MEKQNQTHAITVEQYINERFSLELMLPNLVQFHPDYKTKFIPSMLPAITKYVAVRNEFGPGAKTGDAYEEYVDSTRDLVREFVKMATEQAADADNQFVTSVIARINADDLEFKNKREYTEWFEEEYPEAHYKLLNKSYDIYKSNK